MSASSPNNPQTKPTWSERWRLLIRAVETSIVIGFVIAAMTAPDLQVSFLMLLAGCVVGVISISAEPKRPRKNKIIFSSAVVFLFLALGGWLHYHNQQQNERAVSSMPSTSNNNSLDNEISFSCELMVPPKSLEGNSNGSVWVYILRGPPPNLAHAWGYIGVPAGSPAPEPSNVDQKTFSVSKCSITNYSDESLIGVYTTLSAYFCPLKKINNGWVVQNPISSEQIKTPSFNVPPATSPNNTQFFYIENPTPYFAQMTVPSEVAFANNGSTNGQTAELIPPTEPSVPGIWPGIPPTNPPAAPLPSPAPSVPQKRTMPQTPPSPASQ
jgi:hypothetical protein